MKKNLVKILLLIIFGGFSNIYPTNSKFISTQIISDNTFSIIDEFDITPPTSEIIDLPYITNQNPLDIVYYSEDTDIDHVDLCSSFNLGPYYCQNNFKFNFENGDGTYFFYTQATDKSGNTEDAKPYYSTATIFDTIAPTTNLLLDPDTKIFTGKSLLPENNWTIIGNGETKTDGSIQLGIGDSDSIDQLIQKILLPHNLSSNLTFSFNYSSADFPEYDYFNVKVSTASAYTNILNIGGTGVTGWQTISHSLLQWAGQTVDLIFSLKNSGSEALLSSSVLLKNINIFPIDIQADKSTEIKYLATDLGSGIYTNGTDLAGNTEMAHQLPIKLVDEVLKDSIATSSMSFDLTTQKINSKILLSIYGIADTSVNLEYTINYTSNDVEQQIAGTILPHTIDKNNSVYREFYLGTCSTGVCIPALNIGSSISVTFSDLPTKWFLYY